MVTRSKDKKVVAKKRAAQSTRTWAALFRPFIALITRAKSFRSRRPHRSFRMTRRRDALKPLRLPGYWKMTKEVTKLLLTYKKTFIGLAVVYAVAYAVLVGVGSQDLYTLLGDTLTGGGASIFQGNWGEISKAGIIFFTVVTTGLNDAPTDAQQVYILLITSLIWLTTIWILRNRLAGRKVNLRDGLYSAAAPLIAALVIILVMAVQLIPVGIATLGYTAAGESGLMSGGVETMMFWFFAAILAMMSLYWIVSSFFALIIITLPGTYPFKALSIAGDMVVGRRLKILLRILWAALLVTLVWAVLLISIILLDTWLANVWSGMQYIPLVPMVVLALSSSTAIWVSGYIYVLYRKVIDEDAKYAS